MHPYAWTVLLLCAFLVGCQPPPEAASGHGHSHGGETTDDHGHDHDSNAIQVTLWNDHIEIFAEYEPFVINQTGELVVHVTHLQDFKPRREGPLKLTLKSSTPTLTGSQEIPLLIDQPARDGIYLAPILFPETGMWIIEVRVPTDQGDSLCVIENVHVYADSHEAAHALATPHQEGKIGYLKEQQWQTPFATAQVRRAEFRENLQLLARVEARAGGRNLIQAPVAGRLLITDEQPPHEGMAVQKGQVLGYLVPRLDSSDDLSSLEQALQIATIDVETARDERDRLEPLFKEKLVPQQQWQEAERDVRRQETRQQSAKARLEQFLQAQSQSKSPNNRAVPLQAAISGTVVASHFVAGSLVETSQELFEVVDLERMWMEVAVPEAYASRIANTPGLSYRLEGDDVRYDVIHGENARRIAVGLKVDPVRRTLPVIFEIENAGGQLHLGMTTSVNLFTGQSSDGLAIPREAIVEIDGLPCAFVQVSGESFDKRILNLGLMDGDQVEVLSGLAQGERIVTQGAYQIRLAASGNVVPDHGHAH